MKKIRLSYSSLNMLNGISHEWVVKQMGIPVPSYPFLNEGKQAHRIIQDHVSGRKRHPLLAHIKTTFKIVEEKEFDERCKFIFPWGEKYEIIGFVDGLDRERQRFLEIKTSGDGGWSLKRFKDSMQRKLYAACNQHLVEAYLITGGRSVEDWQIKQPKLFSLRNDKHDVAEAVDWVNKGITILEAGEFTGGLDENGRCEGCFYNMARYPELANCHFL